MRNTVTRTSCFWGLLIAILAFVIAPTSAQALEDEGGWDWSASTCWQTGHFGVSSLQCVGATKPGYLATHMVNDTNGVEDFKQPSGIYCSWSGLPASLDEPEPVKSFPTVLEPYGEYQEGDGKGNVCGSWANPYYEWGVKIENVNEHRCTGEGERESCWMQNYLSLAGQGLSDRPWASYFGNPRLDFVGGAKILAESEYGWSYACAVLEDATTGNILEACGNGWQSSALLKGEEWRPLGPFVLECNEPRSGFEHSVDRVANVYEEGMRAAELEQIVELDNTRYTHKAEGGRAKEPEFGAGCGRHLSTSAAEWALIGVSVGVEEWNPGQLAGWIIHPAEAETLYDALPIGFSPKFSAGLESEQVTLSGTINPYGVRTEYIVEYGEKLVGEHTTAATLVSGEETSPVEVKSTLTGLRPASTYHYRIKAFHPQYFFEPEISDITYSAEHTFTTRVKRCGGANVTAAGSTLQKLAQAVWTPDFDTSKNSAACGGEAKPKITYQGSIGGGAGLESWGVNGHTATFGTANAFVATDEPPTESQKAEIEAHGTGGKLLTIPVSQTAVTIPMHLPENCTATSTAVSGRLVLTNTTLEKIFRRAITKWSQIKDDGDKLSGTSCNKETEITRVVAAEGSGTTAILMKYLDVINGKAVLGEKTWRELGQLPQNVKWPEETTKLVRGTGDTGIASEVAKDAGSIGYVDLPDARANGSFTPPPGAPERPSSGPSSKTQAPPTATRQATGTKRLLPTRVVAKRSTQTAPKNSRRQASKPRGAKSRQPRPRKTTPSVASHISWR